MRRGDVCIFCYPVEVKAIYNEVESRRLSNRTLEMYAIKALRFNTLNQKMILDSDNGLVYCDIT
jgi:hypothetical protein